MPTAHFKYAVGISYFCISVFFRFGMSEISRSAKASSFACGSSLGSASHLRKSEKTTEAITPIPVANKN